MVEFGRDTRQLVCELAVALPCVWAGYFFTHTWKSLDTGQLLLLCGAAALCVGGAARAVTLRQRRRGGVAIWFLGGVVALGPILAALADAGALFAAGMLLVVAILRSDAAWSTPGARCVLGLLFACTAASLGFVVALPVSAQVARLALALGIYVGLVETIIGDPPVTRPTFGLVLGLMIALVLAVGAFGLAHPHGLLGAALAVWLAARLGIVGARVPPRYTPDRARSFAEQAQLGTGLLAGALLTLTVEGSVPNAAAELAWAVAAGAFSFVLMRLWPLMASRREEEQD